MKALLLTVTFFCVITTGNSQEKLPPEKKVFVIKAGETISDVIPFSEVYTYPSFTNGMVHFRSGDVSQGRLNYNILTSEMDFIDGKGDTLALADEPLVKMIVIGKDSFYFDNGYVKLVASSKDFKLGKRSVFTTVKIEKTGAYDQPMAANMDTYGGISSGNRMYNLVVRQNITLVKEAAYYFGNKNNEFLPVNRKNLMKSYSKYEKQLQEYLNANDIHFGKEEDLVKIIRYLQAL